MTRIFIGLIFCLAIIPAACLADEIVFQNSERLVGRLLKMEKGKLVFKSDTIGEVTVDAAKVKSLATIEEVVIRLKNGTEIRSKALQPLAEEGVDVITGMLPQHTLAFADIASIQNLKKTQVTWSGHISAGFTGTNGNSLSEQYNLDFSIMRRSEKHRLKFSGLYLAGREENPDDEQDDHEKDKITVEENYTIKGKYDYFFTKKYYGYLSGSFKKDHIADLDHRIILSAGGGYQWIDTDSMRLSTDLGFAHLHEKFSARVPDPNAKDETSEGSETETRQDDAEKDQKTIREVTRNSEFSLQLGSNFEWQINETFNFIFNLTYNPSISDLSDYYLTSDAEIRLSLTKRMYSSFKAILDYDSTPGEDVGSTDTKYILGFGWGF